MNAPQRERENTDRDRNDRALLPSDEYRPDPAKVPQHKLAGLMKLAFS
jgi:hypothetical protein